MNLENRMKFEKDKYTIACQEHTKYRAIIEATPSYIEINNYMSTHHFSPEQQADRPSYTLVDAETYCNNVNRLNRESLLQSGIDVAEYDNNITDREQASIEMDRLNVIMKKWRAAIYVVYKNDVEGADAI